MNGLEKPPQVGFHCRLCAVHSFLGLHLFGFECRRRRVAEKLHKYFALKINKDDNLPKMVCIECVKQVLFYHDFFQGTNRCCNLPQDILDEINGTEL